jgi:hypothetical protein
MTQTSRRAQARRLVCCRIRQRFGNIIQIKDGKYWHIKWEIGIAFHGKIWYNRKAMVIIPNAAKLCRQYLRNEVMKNDERNDEQAVDLRSGSRKTFRNGKFAGTDRNGDN